MAKAKTPEREGPHKKKVFFKVRVGDEYTEYVAYYDGLEIEGLTMGDKKDIKDVVRRIILAPNEPPEFVVKAAVLVTNHVSSAIHSNAKVVWGGIGVEFGDNERLKLGASLQYYVSDDDEEGSGWVGEVTATFSGYDGLMVEGVHEVVKKVDFGEDIDVMGLYRQLLKVARHAYNAYPSF